MARKQLVKCAPEAVSGYCLFARHSSAFLLVAIASLVQPLHAAEIQAEAFDKDTVVAAVESYYSRFKYAQFLLTADNLIVTEGARKLTEREEIEITVDRNNDSIRDYRTRFNVKGDGRIEGQERIYTPSTFFLVATEPETGKAIAASSRFKVDDNDRQEQLSKMFFSVLVGYLPLSETATIGAMLNSADELHLADAGDASLRLQGRHGMLTFEVSVNPSQAFIPNKIVLRTHSTDLSFRRYEYSVENVQDFGGVYFPTEVSIHTEEQRGDSATRERVRIVKVKEFSNAALDKSAFSLRTEMPNGMTVFMRDAPHLPQLWKDGKLIPKAPTVIMASGESFQTPPYRSPSSGNRSILVFLNIAVILLLVLLYVRRKHVAAS